MIRARIFWCIVFVFGLAVVRVGRATPIPIPDDPYRIALSHIVAERAENLAKEEGLLVDPVYSRMKFMVPYLSPLSGLRFEVSLAPPASDMPTDPYELAKYGRLTLEYNNFAVMDGAKFGVAVQALHVAHHLLLYSGGITSDINNDGMFLITVGVASYQTGNSRAEPFVTAPFARMKFQSSERVIFLYSELEATMNARAYISGTTGVGLRVSPFMTLIGGYQHTEFIMPTEQAVRMVNGFQGTVQWGM